MKWNLFAFYFVEVFWYEKLKISLSFNELFCTKGHLILFLQIATSYETVCWQIHGSAATVSVLLQGKRIYILNSLFLYFFLSKEVYWFYRFYSSSSFCCHLKTSSLSTYPYLNKALRRYQTTSNSEDSTFNFNKSTERFINIIILGLSKANYGHKFVLFLFAY